MNNLKPKVSIIGCGNVGMRYAYALMIKGVVRQIVLVDIDRIRLEGEVMDLCHSAPYIEPTEITAGDCPNIEDSDLVVITAGRKQKHGQTRLDLAKDNVEIFRKIISEVMKYAPDAILLIVTNPVDVLSYAAYKLSGKPAKKVIGSGTVLDTARFIVLVGGCSLGAATPVVWPDPVDAGPEPASFRFAARPEVSQGPAIAVPTLKMTVAQPARINRFAFICSSFL